MGETIKDKVNRRKEIIKTKAEIISWKPTQTLARIKENKSNTLRKKYNQ